MVNHLTLCYALKMIRCAQALKTVDG